MTSGQCMGRLRLTARWTLLLLSLVIAAIYLNSAFFSARVSGGPPNPYPHAWSQRGVTHLCLAGAFLFGGIAIYRLIGSFPKIGVLTIIFAVVAVLFPAVPYVREFWYVDACLDRGGRWNSLAFQCER